MVLLAKDDVKTQEVFNWQGIHLLHFSGSTCSKKIRILLALKKIDWESHPINLVKRENNSDWFMGINPRGLVPVLVHDGQIHIESNDILEYLEHSFPNPKLIPEESPNTLTQLLQKEDELHVDLRNLTMRFTAPSKLMQRSREELEHYDSSGSGMVGGKPDAHKAEELDYWRQFAANKGVTDSQIVASTARFKHVLDQLDRDLESTSYLLGNDVSLADISWFVTINRIMLAGYPLQKTHPNLWIWRQQLMKNPAFSLEASAPLLQTIITKAIWLINTLRRKTLGDIARMRNDGPASAISSQDD